MEILYRSLANNLARGIDAGIYKVGERMPGIRATSSDKGVSAATAVAAYRQLELEGYLEARPRSGFFVRPRKTFSTNEPAPVKTLKKRPSLVNSQERVLNLLEPIADPAVVKFGAAVPDASYLPTSALEQALKKAARMERKHVCNYESPVGTLALRQQIAKRMTDIGCLTEPDDIIITNGCQEAVYVALRTLTKPGDVVVMESPTFHGHLQAAESLGLKVLEIPSHPRTGISLQALEMALERWPVKACMVIPNFSNPAGACMPDKKKRELYKLLDNHDIPLIEDDIYGDLSFNQRRPSVIKSLDKKGSVIYCSSFSKNLAPGLRIGWMIAGRYHNQANYQKFTTSVSSNTIAQYTIADLMASGRFVKHLRYMRTELEKAVSVVSEAISQHFPRGTCITKPQGGYVLWIEIPDKKIDTEELARNAIKKNISIAPGSLFSASGKFHNYLRISCAVKWDAQAEEAIAILGKMIRGSA